MIDIAFETPNQVDKLADFAIEKISSARNRVLYVAFLFSNQKVWEALKKKVLEGIQVDVFAPPITSYSGDGIPTVFDIYKDAGNLASEKNNFNFYVCPLWWQKDRSLTYLRSLINVAYTLHAKLLVVDDSTYIPSSNFESARHYDVCVYSDNKNLADECHMFSKDLMEFSVDMKQTAYASLPDMIREAARMTILSKVQTQKPFRFKHMLFVAPFYRYEPQNYVRQQIAGLLNDSREFLDVMFQHFMPDVKPWSEPKSPNIMESLLSRHRQGVDVRLLAASGVSNKAAIKAEDAPMLKPLYNENRIRRSTRVHAKFICTDRGFIIGSMNINPSSLFQAYFDKKIKVDIDPSLHILLSDAIPQNYEAEKYGTIWQSPGFKSSVDVLMIQNWNEENNHMKGKLRGFFNQSWSEVGQSSISSLQTSII